MPEKITIELDWLHQFQFAGYYIAKEKGFYKEENLDVNIKEFAFDVDVVKDVLSKKNTYGVGKSSLIIDRLEGKNVVLLSAIYQSSPMVLLTLKKSNITSPNELKDKKVMLTPDARSAASINSMIISQGLELKDIDFQKHSFNLDDLISGKTDAMGCYLSNEPYLLEKKGIKYNILNPSDYGFDFYGGIFFTSENEIKNHSKRVRAVYRATMRGWEYAFEHIEETAKLIYNKYNTQHKSLDSLIYEGEILKKISKIDQGMLGVLDKKRIDEIKRLYILLGFGKSSHVPKADEFIYNISKISYTKDQKEFAKQTDVKLLTNDSFPPFTIDVNGQVSGLEVDYWNLISKKINFRTNSIEVYKNLNEGIKKVKENGNFVKYVFSKKDLDEQFTYTEPIAKIKLAIATLANRPYIADTLLLKNKKVAISKYSLVYDTLIKNYPKINFVLVSDLNEALKLLKEKEVYALVAKMPAINYVISNRNLIDVKIAGSFDEKFNMRLLVNKDNKMLVSILNEAISTISDNDRELINSKYYSIIKENKTDYSSLYKIVLPLLIILIFIIRSNRLMNKEIKRREQLEKELHTVANIDSLTKIYNRRKMESLIDQEVQRSRRYERDLSIIFFDIDNFKQINDVYGHSVGDEVLLEIATIVKNNIRNTDYLARWGGEEFIIALTETNKEKAANIATILKDKISNHNFGFDKIITCSFGVTQILDTDTEDTILTRVDQAMYYVKKNGKNNIKVV